MRVMRGLGSWYRRGAFEASETKRKASNIGRKRREDFKLEGEDSMNKTLCTICLGASLALPVAAFGQQTTTTATTPSTVSETTTTATATPTATTGMTKGEIKAQRKQQKQQEKAAKESARAQKAQASALEHQDKATDASEKANTPQ
jgi:hypothetical protein